MSRRSARSTIAFVGLCLAFSFAIPQSPAADTPAAIAATQPVVVPASIEAFDQVDLYSKLSGFVSGVKADIGDSVKQGQVLATVDDPELEGDLKEARAMLAARKQMLDASDAAIRQAQQALEVSKQQVGRFKAEMMLQDLTRKRQEELFAGNAITQQQLDDVRSKSEIARADVGVAMAKVGSAEADLASSQAARGVAAAQVDVAASQIEKIEILLNYRSIVAPFDGVIARRTVNPGDLAQAATSNRTFPLFTVQRIDVLRVRCDVPEIATGRISVGMSAAIKIPGMPGDPLPGKVARFARSLNPETRTMRVEVDLQNPERRILPGMYAQVTLTPAK